MSDSLFPMMVDLRGAACVVVGGGAVAARKARAFFDAGAKVRMIAPNFSDSCGELARIGVEMIEARYGGADQLEGARIVAAATGDVDVDRRVADDARSIGAFVNCATEPEVGSFVVPASFCRGEIAISVSCGVPALAKVLRDRIDLSIAPGVVELAEFLRAQRDAIKRSIESSRDRTALWRTIPIEDALDLASSGRVDEAKSAIADALARAGLEIVKIKIKRSSKGAKP